MQNNTFITTNNTVTAHKSSRNNSIELLRIIFTISVILFHTLIDSNRRNAFIDNILFQNSYLAVECFFVIGGFFLYYSIIKYKYSHSYFIKNLYLRLAPPLIIVFLLKFLLGTAKIKYIFNILALNAGLSLPGEITAFGDWYISVYFWLNILFFNLLYYKPKQNLIIVLVIVFFALSIMFATQPLHGNAKFGVSSINGFYINIIGVSVIRGLIYIGIGILFASVALGINFINNKYLRIIYTVLEITLLILLLTKVLYKLNIDTLTMAFALGIFIVISIKQLGYLSIFLNKVSIINFASKYAYSTFVSHILFVTSYHKIKWFNAISPNMQTVAILLSAIMLGVIIYHFVEIKLANWFKNKAVENLR